MHRVAFFIAASLVTICTAAPVALAVDAKQLTDEFAANQTGFLHKYQGQTLSVSGPIYRLMLDQYRTGQATSGPSLQLTGSFWRITCYLNDADEKRAESLATGQDVTITGTFVGAGGVELSFAPCTFK